MGVTGGVVVATCLVTAMEREADFPMVSVTVTVMTFTPGLNGAAPIDQLGEPVAVPLPPWLPVQTT